MNIEIGGKEHLEPFLHPVHLSGATLSFKRRLLFPFPGERQIPRLPLDPNSRKIDCLTTG
jgi:hypothetical protein